MSDATRISTSMQVELIKLNTKVFYYFANNHEKYWIIDLKNLMNDHVRYSVEYNDKYDISLRVYLHVRSN